MQRILVAVLLCVLMAGCDSSSATSEPDGGGTTTTTTTSVPPPPPVSVPDVQGMPRADAEADVQGVGLVAEVVDNKYSHSTPNTVVGQDPAKGTEVDDGATVELVIAKRYPRIAKVVGKQKEKARQLLNRAGYKTTVTIITTTTHPDGQVASQHPAGGTEALPGRLVKLVVWKNQCTPGYSPCLPLAYDYDCSGGSGDGPKYTGYHRVNGPDPYGLDDDNDGAGCE